MVKSSRSIQHPTNLQYSKGADSPTSYRDKGNHFRASSGVEKLKEKHDFGQMKIEEESWREFRSNENSSHYHTLDGSLSRGIVTLDITLSSGRPPYSLSVSFSRHGKITEFEYTIEVTDLDFKGKSRNAQFPGITGDWTGSGNAEFLKRLNLSSNKSDASKSGELSERLYKSSDHDHDIYFSSIVLASCLSIKGRTLTASQSRVIHGKRYLLSNSS